MEHELVLAGIQKVCFESVIPIEQITQKEEGADKTSYIRQIGQMLSKRNLARCGSHADGNITYVGKVMRNTTKPEQPYEHHDDVPKSIETYVTEYNKRVENRR